MKKILGALFYDVYKGIKERYLMVSEITPEILRAILCAIPILLG